ncbi:MAG: hypothetical protein ABSF29_00690 [Tepidisphaeraceae bacterium]|jgi:hypothetical protein
MHFHLVQIVSSKPNHHGLLGYREVIESIQWGLQALGHQVTTETNAMDLTAINIVFGIQMVSQEQLLALPDNTIIYNLEQFARSTPEDQRPQVAVVAKRFQVWDYTVENVANWENLQPTHRPVHVPIGYAPILARIPARENPPIDVLFYGIPSIPRMETFYQICRKGMHAMFVCGLYGKDRDEMIERSKIVLNLNQYDQTRVFEIVRVSYLLANAKAVVSDLHPNTLVEPDMMDAVEFASTDKIADACWRLISDNSARRELEQKGRAIFQKRDIRQILARAIQAIG